jgi:hypothetical protein
MACLGDNVLGPVNDGVSKVLEERPECEMAVLREEGTEAR